MRKMLYEGRFVGRDHSRKLYVICYKMYKLRYITPLSPPPPPPLSLSHTHTRTLARTHAHTHKQHTAADKWSTGGGRGGGRGRGDTTAAIFKYNRLTANISPDKIRYTHPISKCCPIISVSEPSTLVLPSMYTQCCVLSANQAQGFTYSLDCKDCNHKSLAMGTWKRIGKVMCVIKTHLSKRGIASIRQCFILLVCSQQGVIGQNNNSNEFFF